VGLVAQRIRADSLERVALEFERQVSGITRGYRILMRIDRRVDRKCFGHSFHLPGSSHWSAGIVRPECCSPQGGTTTTCGGVLRFATICALAMLVPAAFRAHETAGKGANKQKQANLHLKWQCRNL
jgi:hypothetical protein